MVVVALVDGVAPEVPAALPMALLPPLLDPGPPMELVLPDVSPLAVPGVVLPLPVLLPPAALVPLVPGEPLVLLEVDVSLPGAGFVVVVLDELDDVVGVPVWSLLVQAPRETAATNASAAHEMADAFIRKLLWGYSKVARAAIITALTAL